MARKLRLEFPGACYHVINRGNYRADLFTTEKTKAAFEACLFEACRKSAWVLHAFVIMRNHYHLALETPQGNRAPRWRSANWSGCGGVKAGRSFRCAMNSLKYLKPDPFSLPIFLLLLAVTSGCAQSKEPNMNEEQAYIDKMASNMREASLWVVQHGIGYYTRGGKEVIEQKLIDEWAGQLWVDPSVGTSQYIALFQIKGRGIYCDIQCLNRLSSDAVFEYWHVMITGKDWAGVGKRCMFIVTQTDRVDGVRKIVHQSDRFFPSYKVSESVTVQLPLDDLQLLYKLKAWQFPECFPDSDLKNWEIGIERDGRYVRVRAKR